MTDPEIVRRITAIERRLTALEQRGAPGAKKSCKQCGSQEREFVSSRRDPHFGVFGATIDEYRCLSCDLIFEEHNDNR